MSRRRGPSKEELDSATIIALCGVLALGGAILGLTAMVFPNVLALVALVAGFTGFIGVQYLLWGRWLTKKIREEEENTADETT